MKRLSELTPVFQEIGSELIKEKINNLMGRVSVELETGNIFRAKNLLKQAIDLLDKS